MPSTVLLSYFKKFGSCQNEGREHVHGLDWYRVCLIVRLRVAAR